MSAPIEDHRVPTQPGAPEPDPLVTVPDPDAAAGAFPPPVAAPEERTDEEGAPHHPAAPAKETVPGDEADVAVPPSAAEGVGRTSNHAPTPSGPPCEKCGDTIERRLWELGFLRCQTCDPDGDHIPADNGECRICVCPTCGKPRWSTT